MRLFEDKVLVASSVLTFSHSQGGIVTTDTMAC